MRRKTIQNEEHVLVLLKVLESDAFGRPVKCDVLYEDMSTQLVGGEEFITAWVPMHLTTMTNRGDA